jgi:hypothetical protein
MSLKEKFAKKMLKEELDFLPLKESLELYETGVRVETRFSWVVRTEELEDNGEDMTTAEILAEIEEVYGLDNDYALTIGDRYDEFDEFTLELCPAPTYIDLIAE